MDIFDAVTLLGGLSMLLFGMGIMGDALKKSAGSRLKTILGNLTGNPIKGFFVGAIGTIVMQSSSATTVMIVGFVNSGAMTISQTIPLILGANVGTTATAWLLSTASISGNGNFILKMLKPSFFSPLLALVGLILYLFVKRGKKHDIGTALLGFGVMMYGMEAMSGAVSNLPDMSGLFVTLGKNPLFGIIAGLVVTAIIQSSAASVGMLQALSLTGSISFASAIPIVMGQNIGTCATALISSIGANKNAKKTAVIHLAVNLIGTIVFIIPFTLLNYFLPSFSTLMEKTVNPVGIAAIHTVFKLLTLLIFLPYPKILEKTADLVIRNGKNENEKFVLLDERLIETPSLAIDRCRKIENDMATLSCGIFKDSLSMLENYDEKKAVGISKGEEETDEYEDRLGTYMVKLSGKQLNDADGREISMLLHLISDFERISDHAVNVLESANEMREKKLSFSDGAKSELSVLFSALDEIISLSEKAFIENDVALAMRVEPLEEVVDTLISEIKRRHIDRLKSGECTIELGFILEDILIDTERVSDHCSNIAVCVIEISHNSFDTHGYFVDLKKKHADEFNKKIDEYKNKYYLA